MRKGRFSKQESKFIEENADILSYEEMATHLNRDPDSVENFAKNKLGKNVTKSREFELRAGYDLKSRPYWKDLKEQFSKSELEMVVYHWGRIISQFKDDLLPTEELQVIDAIKLEVLMNRALKEQQINMDNIDMYEQILDDEKALPLHEQDRDKIFNIERQIAVARAAQETLSRDYKDLQVKKNNMLKELKGTREQRIKRLEDSRQTFLGWVKVILDNPETRREMGDSMEKMRLAQKKERDRLSTLPPYEADMIDQPFLTPDSVSEENG